MRVLSEREAQRERRADRWGYAGFGFWLAALIAVSLAGGFPAVVLFGAGCFCFGYALASAP